MPEDHPPLSPRPQPEPPVLPKAAPQAPQPRPGPGASSPAPDGPQAPAASTPGGPASAPAFAPAAAPDGPAALSAPGASSPAPAASRPAPYTSFVLPPRPSFRKTCSRVGASFSVMMLLFILGQSLLMSLFDSLFPRLMRGSAGLWLCTDLALYGLGAPAAFLLLRGSLRRLAPAPRPARPARMTLPWAGRLFCLGELLMTGGNLIGLGILQVLAYWTGGRPANAVAEVLDGSSMLANLFFCVLVAAVGEELLFRELLFRVLAPYGERAYLLLSAGLFAAFHGNLNQIPYAFLLGLLLAWLRCRTGRVYWGMLLHGAINFCGGILPYLIMDDPVLTTAWGAAILAFCVAGAVYLSRMRPPRVLRRAARQEARRRAAEGVTGPLGTRPARDALVNPGMITAMALTMLLVILMTVSTMGIGA